MSRSVILSFVARDVSSAAEITLHPGDLVEGYRIRRDAAGPADDGVYFMEFESQGHRLRCPLVCFQARTASVTSVRGSEAPEQQHEALARLQ